MLPYKAGGVAAPYNTKAGGVVAPYNTKAAGVAAPFHNLQIIDWKLTTGVTML